MKVLSIFKSLLIWLLIVLALYQTGRLWFVNITNRDFFLFPRWFDNVTADISSPLFPGIIRPYRVIIGTGTWGAGARSNLFTVRYTGLDDAVIYYESVLADLHKNGVFVKEGPYDEIIPTLPVCRYEYTFPVPVEIFSHAFRGQPSLYTNRDMIAFDAVAIFPSFTGDEGTRVVFYNEDYCWEYNTPAAYAHLVPGLDKNAAVYEYKDGGFNPVKPVVDYKSIRWLNPYANDFGEKHLNFIKGKVAPFFDNPAAIKEGVGADGVYCFSNINTVVRYYGNDILTYASYRAVDTSIKPDLMTDYAAAVAFIASDENVINYFYLSGYEKTDGRHIFWFEYAAENGPLWTGTTDKSPIEVVTERGMVLRYNKLVYNFYLGDY